MNQIESVAGRSPGCVLWAAQALTAHGWQTGVSLRIGADGRIASLVAGARRHEPSVAVLLPAPGNVHSHAFQRLMAGRTERQGGQGQDSFWTWRTLMYRFIAGLAPVDLESVAAFAYLQMLKAGFASVGEFHYVHHQPDGRPYADIGEMSHRLAAAAAATGIGLTLLPVLYQQGGCDGRPLEGAQRRFGCDEEAYGRLLDSAGRAVAAVGPDSVLGVAPHSMRAVPVQTLGQAAGWLGCGPIHIHVAEQPGEVDEILAHTGRRPVQWLLEEAGLDARWCCVHATHMTEAETDGLAASGAVAGLCPVTEANLGDGIFAGERFVRAGGLYAVGTDSNVRISLAEELRLLEYSQRLRSHRRAVLAGRGGSVGRALLDSAAQGAARALGRDSGVLAPGRWADMIALDGDAVELHGLDADALLDAWIFAAPDGLVTDVWSAGRHRIHGGRHRHEDAIVARYRRVVERLAGDAP